MKVKLLSLITIGLLLFAGCGPSREEVEKMQKQGVIVPTNYNREYRTIVLDSCEYISYEDNGQIIVCHKGNCKFCAERQRQALQNQQEEIIRAIKENRQVSY